MFSVICFLSSVKTEIWLGQNINLPELRGRRRICGISDTVDTIKQALFYFKFTEHVDHLRSNFQKLLFCFVLFCSQTVQVSGCLPEHLSFKPEQELLRNVLS